MTETPSTEDMPWTPAAFMQQFQEASEEAAESQAEFMREMMASMNTTPSDLPDLSALSSFGMGTAMFKSRVQSNGRVSIPDAEREALDIEEGDIVQTIVLPIKRNREDD